MSVSREVIADALNIQPEEVKCESCAYSQIFIGDSYECTFWKQLGLLSGNDYCSFFKKGETEVCTF